MPLNAAMQGNVLVIQARMERIDAAGAIQFKEMMRDLTARASDRVVLDLSQVGFLDSSGLGAVVSVMKMLSPARRLELAGLTPPVEKVFRLTRMDTVFTIHPVLDAALASGGLRNAG
ncbi:STAS domain-containing protein [Pseudogemmobacter sonorensis]|uniref:STAS domain-containing protein n=1 Tax=Pseudogemmobacter sonorensis TaxID=2989681 RepID=UPI0036A98829